MLQYFLTNVYIVKMPRVYNADMQSSPIENAKTSRIEFFPQTQFRITQRRFLKHIPESHLYSFKYFPLPLNHLVLSRVKHVLIPCTRLHTHAQLHLRKPASQSFPFLTLSPHLFFFFLPFSFHPFIPLVYVPRTFSRTNIHISS